MYAMVILAVLLSVLGAQPDCEMNEAVMRISLNVLISREMIELSDRDLNVRVPEQYAKYLPREIEVGGNVLPINANHLSRPDVIFTKVNPSDTGSVEVSFRTLGSAYLYSGTIMLQCSEGKYVLNTVHYVSAIE